MKTKNRTKPEDSNETATSFAKQQKAMLCTIVPVMDDIISEDTIGDIALG